MHDVIRRAPSNKFRVALAATLAAAATGVSVLASAPVASANGPCSYFTTDNTYVRENPSINSVVRKTKPILSAVTGPAQSGACFVPTRGTDGREWLAVDCSCATDGIGYIIADKLAQVVFDI